MATAVKSLVFDPNLHDRSRGEPRLRGAIGQAVAFLELQPTILLNSHDTTEAASLGGLHGRVEHVREPAHLVALHPQRALECLCNVLVVLYDKDTGCAGEVVHELGLYVTGGE